MSIAQEMDRLFTDLPLEVRRQLCHASSLAWAMQDKPHIYKPYWHSKLIDKKIDECLFDDSCPNHLQISMPPRMGKSDFGIRYGATRYLARNPDHNVFVVTYNASLAGDFGREARHIFESNASEIFGLEVDSTSRSDNKWRVAGHEGSFNGIGWGGPITGKKVHLLIIDDLFKNDEEALSPRIRDKIWSWLQGTAFQRIQNNKYVKTKTISIGTRWHSEDHFGRMLEMERSGGKMRWEKVVLPAIAEDKPVVVDGKTVMEVGDVLCDDILPKEDLELVKSRTSRFFWNATYMQRPITQDGLLWGSELFPDDLFVDSWPSRLMYLVVGLDPALGNDLRRGDYSAIVALGLDFNGQLYCEADMEKTGPVETNRRLIHFLRRLPMAPDTIAVESNGFQILFAQSAVDAIDDANIHALVEAVDNQRRDHKNKEDRITDLDPLIRDMTIKFVRSTGSSLLVSQLKNFPSKDHDDGPDALEIASWILSQY